MPVSHALQQSAIFARLCEILEEAWHPQKVHTDTPHSQEKQGAKRIAFLYLFNSETSEESSIGEERADLHFEASLLFPKPPLESLHKAKRDEAEAFRVRLTTGRRLVAGGTAYNREWLGEDYIPTDPEVRQMQADSTSAIVTVRFVIEGVKSAAY